MGTSNIGQNEVTLDGVETLFVSSTGPEATHIHVASLSLLLPYLLFLSPGCPSIAARKYDTESSRP